MSDRSDSVGDAVARLIRLAGPGEPLERERRERMERTFRDAWSRGLARRRRRRRLAVLAAGLLAAALLVLAGIRRAAAPSAPAETGWRIVRVEGEPALLEEDRGATPKIGDRLRVGQRLLTGSGRIALEDRDGTSLRFDRQTDALVVAPDGLELRAGALYSDSGERPGHLWVDTSAGRVEEIGTRFQVRIGPDRVEVGVRSGRVALARDDGRWIAGAGEGLVSAADPAPGERPERREASPSGSEWAWVQEVSPPFRLDGRSLAEYLDWVERETGREVRVEGDGSVGEAAITTLHGDLSGIRPGDTLDLVVPSVGRSWRIGPSGGIVVGPEVEP